MGLNEAQAQGDEQRIEQGSMMGISRKVSWQETKGVKLGGGIILLFHRPSPVVPVMRERGK